MTIEVEDGYPSTVREIIKRMKDDRDGAKARWYADHDALAKDLRYPSAHNQAIYELLDSDDGKFLRLTSAKLIVAQQRLQKQRDAEAKRAEREQAKAERERKAEQKASDRAAMVDAELGGLPLDEVDYFGLLAAKRGYTMSFDREFRNGAGDCLTGEEVRLDARLTAAKLDMVPPRNKDFLGVSMIDAAFEQWCFSERERCIRQVNQRIAKLSEGDQRTVFDKLTHWCSLYFRDDPGFAAATIRSMFRQIKRRMLDLSVVEPHMLVFVGEQGAGKTTIQRQMKAPIAEVVAEASLKDALDERQMDLLSYALLLLDELVSSDRADVASLKNFITGQSWARRPMKTNIVQKVKLRASLFGTSNHSLGRLIYDSSGMRRFIELEVQSLDTNKKLPNWQEVAAFDWLPVWQAVDAYAECPLLADYREQLQAKQEDLRTADNAELWAISFIPSRSHMNARDASPEWVEFWAQDLYAEFRGWEQEFDRGWRGTNLTRWGRDIKGLIDSGKLPGWSYRRVGTKTLYVTPIPADERDTQPRGNVAMLDKLRRR